MPKTLEKNFWKKVKSHFGTKVRAQRVENSVAPGFPDVVCFLSDGGIMFVELKTFNEGEKKFTVRKEQAEWLYEHRDFAVGAFGQFGSGRNAKLYAAPGHLFEKGHRVSIEHCTPVAPDFTEMDLYLAFNPSDTFYPASRTFQ